MPEQSLKSYDFRIAYGPSDDRLQGFISLRYPAVYAMTVLRDSFPLSHWLPLLPVYPI